MGLTLLSHWMASNPAIASEIGLALLIHSLRQGPSLESIGKYGVRHTLSAQHYVIGWVSSIKCWVYATPNTSLCRSLHVPLGLAKVDFLTLGQGFESTCFPFFDFILPYLLLEFVISDKVTLMLDSIKLENFSSE